MMSLKGAEGGGTESSVLVNVQHRPLRAGAEAGSQHMHLLWCKCSSHGQSHVTEEMSLTSM